MRVQLPGNPMYSISEFLKKTDYFNLSAFLLACQGDFEPLTEIEGEKGAFLTYRKIINYTNFCRTQADLRHHPLILAQDMTLTNWHCHLAAIINSGHKNLSYMKSNEITGPKYDYEWCKGYKCSQQLIDYYQQIPLVWNLV